MGDGCSLIPNLYEIERRNESEAKRTEKQGRGNKLNEATALLEKEIDIVFEKRSWEQVLHNRY